MIAIGHQAALAVEDTTYYSAMVQSERLAAVGQTIATLSHHIKNILQGIRGGSYLVEMGLENDDMAVLRKGWDIVRRNQDKISSLVMDMLSFSKEREPDPVPTRPRGPHRRHRRDGAAAGRRSAGRDPLGAPRRPAGAPLRPRGHVAGRAQRGHQRARRRRGPARRRRSTIRAGCDAAAGIVRITVADNGAGMTPRRSPTSSICSCRRRARGAPASA